jgi:hypothetical protein
VSRDPDPVEEARERIDALLVEIEAGIAVLGERVAPDARAQHATRTVARLVGEEMPAPTP